MVPKHLAFINVCRIQPKGKRFEEGDLKGGGKDKGQTQKIKLENDRVLRTFGMRANWE
jgi:hypothetical protein